MDTIKTVYLKDEIAKCESLDELKERIFPMLHDQKEAWAKKIREIISENNYTQAKLAALCGVDRVSVNKWCSGSIPKNRETFLRIGMAAGYDVAEMNHLLQRYGRYPELYSKSLEDCVCIFVINHYDREERAERYSAILERIKAQIIIDENAAAADVSTVKFDAELTQVHDEDELERFIAENVTVFANAYHKFYAYVKADLVANYPESTAYEMAQAQGWSSSLRQCVSAIRQGKWYPTRKKIISLCLHLSMDHGQTDEMLRLAHMEPLCAKNIFESVIIFIMEDASLQDMLDEKSDHYDPDQLCNYARTILGQLDMPEINDFISELSGVDDE